MTTRRLAIAGFTGAILTVAALVTTTFQPAAADDHGIVVTCETVQVWNVHGLGTVTVTRTGGAEVFTPGNALTVPTTNASGTVTFVDTAEFDYSVIPPSGCVDPTTTTTTTTTIPGVTTTTTPGVTTTTSPGVTTTTPGVTTTAPGATTTVPGSSGVTTTTTGTSTSSTGTATVLSGTALPAAQPASAVVAAPQFTG